MLRKLFLALLFASVFWLIAWSRLLLLSPPASAAFTLPAMSRVTLTPSSAHTNTRRVGVLRRYGAENPLVHDLVVEDNYIWTATNGDGVVRWNRTDGTVVRYNTATGLVHNTVRTILIDKKGNKWFGTENGVSKFNGHTWTTYTTTHGLIDNKVLGIAVDQSDHLWFATWGGVNEFDGRTWTAYTRASGLPGNHIYAVAIDPAGNKWFATPNGVAKFNGRQWTIYTTADGLVNNWVHTIAVDAQGQLWFGTPDGVSKFDGQHWRSYTTADGLVSNHIHAITVDNLGRIWLASPVGVSMFNGQTFQNYTPANGLPRNHITAIATDKAGQPWLGTVDGVIGLNGHTWRSFSAGGLISNWVNAMAEDLSGRKWFATDNGLGVYDGRTWTTYTTADGLASNQVNDLAIDSGGRIWLATKNGINTFDGKRWTTYTTADGLPGNEVKAIGRDEAGRFWFNIRFGDGSGASRFDGQNWTTITDTRNLPVIWDESSVAIDDAGYKWVAVGEEGVQVLDGDKTIVLTTTKNLPFIFTVAIDQSGYKWLGGYGGVSRFDGQHWVNYTTVEGLPRNWIGQIMIDSANHKWFNTMGNGVVELDDTATPVAAQTPPPATPTLALRPPPVVTPAPTPPAAATDFHPALLRKIPLTSGDAKLQEAILDQSARRLYVQDNGGHLYVIDTVDFTKLAVFEVGGDRMTLDAPNHRLYVYPYFPWRNPVTVIDTTALTVAGVISPGREIAVDSTRNQIYVNGQVYDGATLRPLGRWPWQRGVYNPLRDELIRDGLSAWGMDRQTQRLTRDLLPGFTAQECYDCGGTAGVSHIRLFPEQNLIIVETSVNSPGHGGLSAPTHFFDATTLDELTDLTGIPAVEPACNSLTLGHSIGGRIYRDKVVNGYYHYYNLLVYGPNGELETWRDGIDLGITNPNTAQMYIRDFGRLLVLDLSTLSPVDIIPGDCVLSLDPATGRIYVRRGGELLVFADQGGQFKPPPPTPTGRLPQGSIEAIKVSPGYATDRTIFVNVDGQIYRSTTGGMRWVRLRGGLPEKARLDFELSPDFVRDKTLFAGGDYGYGRGAGMYRSIDKGETWQAIWKGLSYLRVYDVAISPNYASDNTVFAYADYTHLQTKSDFGGRGLFRSTTGGLTWTLVISDDDTHADLPRPDDILPAKALPPERFRPVQYGIERSSDGGKTWQPVVISRRPEFSARSIVPSPHFKLDQTLYLLSNEALYRSTDGGRSWEHSLDRFFAGRTYANPIKALAVSPLLKDGSQRLFLGSAAGEFLALDPMKIEWQPVPPAFQWPVILTGEKIYDIAAAPNGDVWLGTPKGLVRYTGETILTRYTITDGLPAEYVHSVALSPDGTLWTESDSLIARFDGQSWTKYDLTELVDGFVIDMAVAQDGTVWVGGQINGVLHWDGHLWEKIIDPAHRTGYRTYGIAGSADGTLWFATANGAAWYKDKTWFGDLGEQYRVAVGPDGAAYFLNDRGSVQRYFNDQWVRLPNPKPGFILDTHPTSGFYITKDNAVWVGTREGVFRYDGKKWRQFTAQDGLPDNKILAIAEDAGGQLWFGTDNGAACVDPATLELTPVAW